MKFENLHGQPLAAENLHRGIVLGNHSMTKDNSGTIPASGTSFDLIIIGGGTIGLSAAYYARGRNLTTLLLEQYDQFANDCASSSGYSRFFRIVHSEEYSAKLAENALALWHEIETASNIEILRPQR